MTDLTPIEFLRETIRTNYSQKLKEFGGLLELLPQEAKQDKRTTVSKLQKVLEELEELKLPAGTVEIETFHLQDIDFMSGRPKGYLSHKRIDSRHALGVFIGWYIDYIEGRTRLEFFSNGKVFDGGLNPDKWIQYISC